MERHMLKMGCSLLVIATLGACSDSNKKSQAIVVNPTGPSQLNSFGTQFAAAFRANPDSEPYTPADTDVPALSLTTEPVAID